MNDKLTIPAYDHTDTETTVIEVPTATKLLLIRNAGAGKVRVHTEIPTSDADQLKGFPLCADATDADKGECYPFGSTDGIQNTLWLTADATSSAYVLARS